MNNDVKLEPCPFCGGEALLENTITQASIMCCDCPCIMRRDHTTRTFDDGTHRVIAAWNQRHQPEREDVARLAERALIVKWLQDQSEKGADYGLASGKGTTRRAAFGGGALALHRAAEAIARGDHIVDDIASKLADGQTESQQPLTALTTPAPAEDDDPDDHLGSKLAAAVERELDRIEQRNSTRQDFTPAFDRELARKVIMAGFGLFSCRGGTTASGYQWMGLLEALGLNKARPVSPAPAVSRDEIDELLYSVIRMPLSNKGGELVRWRKTMSGRLSAILKATPAQAVKPHCSTCGKDVAEVLCETCGKWWDAALLADICDNMAEVLKPLPGEE